MAKLLLLLFNLRRAPKTLEVAEFCRRKVPSVRVTGVNRLILASIVASSCVQLVALVSLCPFVSTSKSWNLSFSLPLSILAYWPLCPTDAHFSATWQNRSTLKQILWPLAAASICHDHEECGKIASLFSEAGVSDPELANWLLQFNAVHLQQHAQLLLLLLLPLPSTGKER